MELDRVDAALRRREHVAIFRIQERTVLRQRSCLHRYTIQVALVFTILGMLTGCGWHLQGSTRLSEAMAVTYIDTADRYTDFNRALRDSLRVSGARITEKRSDATAIVRISQDESGQRVLAVSARNTPEEYQVFYAIEYSVANQSGEVIEPERIELTREYSYDATAVLAKQREQAILREALARDLAALVVRRLGAL